MGSATLRCRQVDLYWVVGVDITRYLRLSVRCPYCTYVLCWSADERYGTVVQGTESSSGTVRSAAAAVVVAPAAAER